MIVRSSLEDPNVRSTQEFNNDVIGRFKILFDNGVLTPLDGTDFIEAELSNLMEGRYLSGEFLGKCSMLTNADMHWLLTGNGNPIDVTIFDHDEDAEIFLDELLVEDFVLHLVKSGDEWLIVATLPISVEVQKTRKYSLRAEVITGNLGGLTRKRLQEANHTHKVFRVEFSRENFDLLRSGQVSFKRALS